jgi:hypothetical protein
MRPSDDGVRDADREERRPPVARRVGGQLHVPPLVRHARDDEPDPRPRVQPVVNEPQLRRLVAHEHGGERRAEAAAAGVEFHQVLLDHLIRPRQQRRRDREAEGLGGLEIDDEFERRGLLDREVGGGARGRVAVTFHERFPAR